MQPEAAKAASPAPGMHQAVIVRPVLCRPFIGRREELAYLRERRLQAASSHGGVVLICGDAGIGKSRLIDEFCGSLTYTRWRVASGACFEFGNRPYGPMLEALAKVDARPFDFDAATTQDEQIRSLAERFIAAASKTALLVVVEDLHWADAATHAFLAYLGARVHGTRILVVASLRPSDASTHGPFQDALAKVMRGARSGQIDLAPLRGTELRAFIDEALDGSELSPDARVAVARASEGNPFFAEELLKSAVERHASGATGHAVPLTIRSALLERLRAFTDGDRRILAQAAVVGRTFTLPLLAATLESTTAALLPALRKARDVQLIQELPSETFRFRHVLTREAIYGEFLSAELPERHRAIALAIEAVPAHEKGLEALAYHWWAAGDASKAQQYNELAGDAATRIFAHEDAIAFYERALALPGADPAARGAITQKIADRRLALGLTEACFATYAAAADLFREAGTPEREAICRVRAAMTAYTMSLADTSGPLEEMLERVDPGEHLARSRVHLGIAWIAVALRAPTRAARHLALVDARAASSASDIAVRYYNVAACVAMLVGDRTRFRNEHAKWLKAAAARGLGAVAGVHYVGARYLSALGLHEEARESLAAAFHLAVDSKSRHVEECAHATAALCHVAAGDLKAARASVDAVPTTTDNRVNFTYAAAAATVIGVYTGDDALLATWFDGVEASIAAAPELEIGAGFATVLARRGRQRDAEELLRRALPDCEVVRGEVLTLLAAGRYGSASVRQRARAYLARAAEAGDDAVEGPALLLFDAYQQQSRGDGHVRALARRAAEAFGRLHYPLLEAEALELAGEHERAAALFRRCGASARAARLSADIAPVREDGAGAAAALSPREREIARLAAQGRSNLDIARALAITHKTVEKHLSSAYRKLGVDSRKALTSCLNATALHAGR